MCPSIHVCVVREAEPCAYLAFGDTYADETRDARERRWSVTVTSGGTWRCSGVRLTSRMESGRLAYEV